MIATFVTRKYPPSVGGMETLSFRTAEALRAGSEAFDLIALGRGNVHLLWWLPVAALRLVGRCVRGRKRVVLFGDALTAAVLGWIPRMCGVPVVTMIMGLDVTYTNRLYQAIVLPPLRRLPLVLAISTATREAALAAGLRPERVRVIVLGLPQPTPPAMSRGEARRELIERFDLAPDGVILATTGRLVRRKGVLWFVENVLPGLSGRFSYLIAGDGPDRGRLDEAARAAAPDHIVRTLGRIDDRLRDLLLHGSDIYVQPNIGVPGDIEGFGLVVTEASQAGLFTVAADREGLVDAVRDGETGVRVPSGDAEAWVDTLERIADDPERAEVARRYQAAAQHHYSVETMARELRQALDDVAGA